MEEKEFSELQDGEIIDSIGDDKPILNKTDEKPGRARWSVGPYVKVRDFNRQGADEFHLEDNPKHGGVEVGLKFTF